MKTEILSFLSVQEFGYFQLIILVANHGPVVQSIVSLTSSLRGQLVKCLRLYTQKHKYFLLKKWEKLFTFFSTKNIGIFEILTFEILTKR